MDVIGLAKRVVNNDYYQNLQRYSIYFLSSVSFLALPIVTDGLIFSQES